MNKFTEGSSEMKEVNIFYQKIFTKVKLLENFSNSFISQNPEWENAIKDGIYDYRTSFLLIGSDESVQNTAKYLNIPIDVVILANKITLIMLFGVSHYLNWADFDIKNPTNFNELSTKLAFTRKALVNIGFSLAVRDIKSDMSEQAEIDCLINGLKIGIAIGYLTSIAYTEGSNKALGMFTNK